MQPYHEEVKKMVKFKQIRTRFCALATAVLISSAIQTPALARCVIPRSQSTEDLQAQRIKIMVDDESYTGNVYLNKGTAFVSLREFAAFTDDPAISWDSETATAYVRTFSLSLSVSNNSKCIEANGRALRCAAESFIKDGKLYVPVRQLSQAFGFTCDYSAEEMTTYLTRREKAVESGDKFYNPDELYWLSRIIEAEAGGEPFDGKLAVGSVILNRKLSDEFPDSIIDVIFDTANGVQFSPVANGTIYNEPSEDSILAAKMTLEGYVVTEDALYFLNQRIAQSFWIVENCTFVMTIGNHDFFA